MQRRFILNGALVVCLYILTAIVTLSLFVHPKPLSLPHILRLVIVASTVITLGRYLMYVLLGSYFGLTQAGRTQNLESGKSYQPFVSVIIPAWNEEVGILTTITSVLASDYGQVEVIVINDGSTDTSDERIRSFLKQYHTDTQRQPRRIPIIYRYMANGGKSRALNTGLALARGDIIISIDADSVVRPNTIRAFVQSFADPAVMAAVDTVKIGNIQTIWGLIQRLEYMTGFYFKRAEAVMSSIYIIGGAAGAFRRSVFAVVGPYSTEHLTEDTELTLRIQKAGLKIAYASTAIVYTEGASTLSGLLRQRLRWKRGRFEAFFEHRELFFSREKFHRKLLGWFVMPLALFGDAHMVLELPFLLIMLAYGIISGDFTPLLVSIVTIACLTFIQIFSSEQGHSQLLLILLAPISWWLLIMITVIELSALARSLWTMSHGQTVTWQKWRRLGLASSTLD